MCVGFLVLSQPIAQIGYGVMPHKPNIFIHGRRYAKHHDHAVGECTDKVRSCALGETLPEFGARATMCDHRIADILRFNNIRWTWKGAGVTTYVLRKYNATCLLFMGLKTVQMQHARTSYSLRAEIGEGGNVSGSCLSPSSRHLPDLHLYTQRY